MSGIYGQFGPFHVLVHQDGAPDAIAVTASAQGQIHRSEAIASLNERTQAKDNAANDTLIITCGRPDQRGFSCPLDAFIYRLIADAADGDVLTAAPEHLNGVALHLWPTNEWIEVYRNVDTPMPWTEG